MFINFIYLINNCAIKIVKILKYMMIVVKGVVVLDQLGNLTTQAV